MSVGPVSSAAVSDPGLQTRSGRDERIAAAEARLDKASAESQENDEAPRVPVGSLGSIVDVYL